MYKKTVIRQYFEQVLKASVPSVAGRVYSGRINQVEDDVFPYITLFSKNESIAEQFTTHTSRELDLNVGIVVSDNTIDDGDFYEVIENVMLEVDNAMGRILTERVSSITDDYFALFEDVVFQNSSTEHDNSSGNDIGMAMMSYKVSYDYALPVIPLTLEDFDWQGSIANIQITNEGVPLNV